MLYSLHAKKNHKRSPHAIAWPNGGFKSNDPYLCCPARDDMTHKSKQTLCGTLFERAAHLLCRRYRNVQGSLLDLEKCARLCLFLCSLLFFSS